MIVEESRAMDVPPDRVVTFLEEIDAHYLDWHPDHIAFDWLDGSQREFFHFEERIGRWRVRLLMQVIRAADGGMAICRPTSRLVRLLVPGMSFAVRRAGRGCRYTHQIKLRLGPLRPLLERTFLAPLRQHMREESAYLAHLEPPPSVAEQSQLQP